LTKTYVQKVKIEITGYNDQNRCEMCGKTLKYEETVFRVFGINKQDFRVKVHYYCESCGHYLVNKYKDKGEWIIEK
jgi:Zn finger protein HypA/HybF involved in hydrogenase expression